MIETNLTIGSSVALPKKELDALLADLRTNGYETVGPHLQDESIVYKQIEGLQDLPRGILSEQAPGSYRMIQTGRERYFDFIPAAQSWKQFLFPARHELFTARKVDPDEHTRSKTGNWTIKENDAPAPRYALVGVRACELSAIEIQDKVFLRPDFNDPIYRARREGLFILAVNCLHPNATCFCTSMGTGPCHRADSTCA